MPPIKKRSVTNTELLSEIYALHETLIRFEPIIEKVKKLDERVNGNGKPGLIQEMILVQEREAKRDRREWFLYTTIFAEAVALLIAVFTA